MNCNHDCNQGRDCPARVAKTKRRYPAHPAPLRQPQHTYLKHLARWTLVCIAVMFAAAFSVGVAYA